MRPTLSLLFLICLGSAVVSTLESCRTRHRSRAVPETTSNPITESAMVGLDTSKVDVLPEWVQWATPEYPKTEKQAGKTGAVGMKGLVTTLGRIQRAEIAKTSGSPAFDTAALRAAYKAKFKPAYKDGKAVNCWVTWKVEFELDH